MMSNEIDAGPSETSLTPQSTRSTTPESVRSITPEYKRSITLFDNNDTTGRVMLNVGAPSVGVLRRAAVLINEASQARLTSELDSDCLLLQYGSPLGDERCLEALTLFLNKEYQQPVNKNDLAITAGASTTLALLLISIFPNKCRIYTEELTYFVALKSFSFLSYDTCPVGYKDDGIDVDELEQIWTRDLTDEVHKSDNKVNYVACLYLVPHFHNPTGSCLSDEKCHKLIKLARRFKVLIISDDVYNLLSYEGKPPKRLFAYDSIADKDYGIGCVVSNNSFSKILSPGIRLGWLEMPAMIKERYWLRSPILNSGGGLNYYMGGVLACILELGGYDHLLQSIRTDNGIKMRHLISVCNQKLPKDFKFYSEPKGGYFAMIMVPLRINAQGLLNFLRYVCGIRLHSGDIFSAAGQNTKNERSIYLKNSLRVSIGYLEVPEFKAAIYDLVDCINTYDSTRKDA
uniref:Aminotran_1_2 domain-containing protein n=1 Tax=Rhabditophanes sp. KR3021 TaxID=114890 RepID=A0AC35TQA7_9BILA